MSAHRAARTATFRGGALRRSAWVVAVPAAATALAFALAWGGIGGGGGGDSDEAASATALSTPSDAHAFAWVRPSAAPAGWRSSGLPHGAARLAYPRGWRSIQSDPGTITAAVRAPGGKIQGYLNATPQQADETLANWSGFRIAHNRDEGDTAVKPVAWANGLRFPHAKGSCVIDDYLSSADRSFREVACIVAGQRGTSVVVGAAPSDQWQQQRPTIERAVSSFLT